MEGEFSKWTETFKALKTNKDVDWDCYSRILKENVPLALVPMVAQTIPADFDLKLNEKKHELIQTCFQVLQAKKQVTINAKALGLAFLSRIYAELDIRLRLSVDEAFRISTGQFRSSQAVLRPYVLECLIALVHHADDNLKRKIIVFVKPLLQSRDSSIVPHVCTCLSLLSDQCSGTEALVIARMAFRLLDIIESDVLIHCTADLISTCAYMILRHRQSGDGVVRSMDAGDVSPSADQLFALINDISKPSRVKSLKYRNRASTDDHGIPFSSLPSFAAVLLATLRKLDKRWLDANLEQVVELVFLFLGCHHDRCVRIVMRPIVSSWLDERSQAVVARKLIELLANSFVAAGCTGKWSSEEKNRYQRLIIDELTYVAISIDSAVNSLLEDESLGFLQWLNVACCNESIRDSAVRSLRSISASAPDRAGNFLRSNIDMLKIGLEPNNKQLRIGSGINIDGNIYCCAGILAAGGSYIGDVEILCQVILTWLMDPAFEEQRILAWTLLSVASVYQWTPTEQVKLQFLSGNETMSDAVSVIVSVCLNSLKSDHFSNNNNNNRSMSDVALDNSASLVCATRYLSGENCLDSFSSTSDTSLLSELIKQAIELMGRYPDLINQHGKSQITAFMRLRLRIYELIETIGVQFLHTYVPEVIPKLAQQLAVDLISHRCLLNELGKNPFLDYFLDGIIPISQDDVFFSRAKENTTVLFARNEALPVDISVDTFFSQSLTMSDTNDWFWNSTSALGNSARTLMSSLVKVMSLKQRQQTFKHLSDVICQSDSPAKDPLGIVIMFSDCLQDKNSRDLVSPELRSLLQRLLMRCIEYRFPLIASLCAADCMGKLVGTCDDISLIAEMFTMCRTKIKKVTDEQTREAFTLMIGYIYRYTGTTKDLNDNIAWLLALFADKSSTRIQMSAIRSLTLLIDRVGNMVREKVISTILDQCENVVIDLEPNTVENSLNNVPACMARMLVSLINACGPKLSDRGFDTIRKRILWLTDGLYCHKYNSATRVSVLHCLQQMHAYASKTDTRILKSLIPELCQGLSCRDFASRKAAVSCLRQLCQVEPREVLSYAGLVIWTDRAKHGLSHQALAFEEYLFHLIDRERQADFVSDVKDIIHLSLFAHDSSLMAWLALLTDVLGSSAATVRRDIGGPVPATKEDNDEVNSEDEQVLRPNTERDNAGNLRGRFATHRFSKHFAIRCLHDILDNFSKDDVYPHFNGIFTTALVASESESIKLKCDGFNLLSRVITLFDAEDDQCETDRIDLAAYEAQVNTVISSMCRLQPFDNHRVELSRDAVNLCVVWMQSSGSSAHCRMTDFLTSSLDWLMASCKTTTHLSVPDSNNQEIRLLVLQSWARVFITFQLKSNAHSVLQALFSSKQTVEYLVSCWLLYTKECEAKLLARQHSLLKSSPSVWLSITSGSVYNQAAIFYAVVLASTCSLCEAYTRQRITGCFRTLLAISVCGILAGSSNGKQDSAHCTIFNGLSMMAGAIATIVVNVVTSTETTASGSPGLLDAIQSLPGVLARVVLTRKRPTSLEPSIHILRICLQLLAQEHVDVNGIALIAENIARESDLRSIAVTKEFQGCLFAVLKAVSLKSGDHVARATSIMIEWLSVLNRSCKTMPDITLFDELQCQTIGQTLGACISSSNGNNMDITFTRTVRSLIAIFGHESGAAVLISAHLLVSISDFSIGSKNVGDQIETLSNLFDLIHIEKTDRFTVLTVVCLLLSNDSSSPNVDNPHARYAIRLVQQVATDYAQQRRQIEINGSSQRPLQRQETKTSMVAASRLIGCMLHILKLVSVRHSEQEAAMLFTYFAFLVAPMMDDSRSSSVYYNFIRHTDCATIKRIALRCLDERTKTDVLNKTMTNRTEMNLRKDFSSFH